LNDLPESSGQSVDGTEYNFATQFPNDAALEDDNEAYDDDIAGSYVD
jgi:hypothetical protein